MDLLVNIALLLLDIWNWLSHTVIPVLIGIALLLFLVGLFMAMVDWLEEKFN